MQEVAINNAPNPILENLNEKTSHNNNNSKQSNQMIKKPDTPPIQQNQSYKNSNENYLFTEPTRQQKKVKDSMDEFDDILKELETKNVPNNAKNNSNLAFKSNLVNNSNRLKDDHFNTKDEIRNISSSKKQSIPSANINNSELDEYISNKKLLFKEKTKTDLASQKKKFDSIFQTSNLNEKNDRKSPKEINKKQQQYDDFFFDDDFSSKKPNKQKTNNNNVENVGIFQEAEDRKYSSNIKKQTLLKQNKFNQNDDLLEELFGDDLFGGSKARGRSPSVSQSKGKNTMAQNKNTYDDIFNNNEDDFFDTKDRNSPWIGDKQEKPFQTRRSRYIPGINSGKKDNLSSKPTSGKWNPNSFAANSATKTGGMEGQKSSYVPSFLSSGNDSSRKGNYFV
jgi:hypothetical protein